MKTRFSVLSLLALAAACLASSRAEATIIFAEAEDATLGGVIISGSDTNALGGGFIDTPINTLPPAAASIATFDLDVPAGTYDLYVRLLVGSGGASDDSFFVAGDFGVAPNLTVNQLDAFNSGFYADADGTPINGFDPGGVANEIYHWINISDNAVVGNDAAGITFTSAGGPTTYEISTRESGLQIDAIAFGLAGTDFTTAQLNAAAVPEPSSLAIGALTSCLLGCARTRRR